MTTLDRDWHVGVCGWLHEGRHVRLGELLLQMATDEERQALIEEHRRAMVLLSLVMAKLEHELQEATDEEATRADARGRHGGDAGPLR